VSGLEMHETKADFTLGHNAGCSLNLHTIVFMASILKVRSHVGHRLNKCLKKLQFIYKKVITSTSPKCQCAAE